MQELALFYPEGHEAHYEPGHPERPERIEAIRLALKEQDWWDAFPHLPPQQLSDELLQAVHTSDYLRILQAASERGQNLDLDTYTTPASWDLALKAAGGAVAIAEAVWQRQARRGFALTRPPGHHATSRQGMGFCLLNNIAIAAEYLCQVIGAQRLAIVDVDLHHGNGTQDIFWRRGDVFYLSTHQSPLYPGTGGLEDVGAGSGEGTNANFPLPPLSGDLAFEMVMDTLILPLLSRFNPEMILVSFGFDPHWLDPLGQLQLSAAGYGGVIQKLVDWTDGHCAGRIALFLEGGYDLEAGAACAQAAVAAMLGLPWQDKLGPAPYPETNAWQSVVRRARDIWQV